MGRKSSKPVRIYFEKNELVLSWQNQIEEKVPLGHQLCINLKRVDIKLLKAVLEQKRYYDRRMNG